ncbi:MAG: TRAP transporter large permease [Betaproteobacteria bacterium]
MELWILFGSFLLLIAFNVPIAFALGISACATLVYDSLPLMVAVQRIASGISVFSLLAIPFFIYAGELMLFGGIAERLVRFANAVVGHVRGGLGLVNVLASMLFGGISGSAVADTSALGSILIPLMKKKGYGADYAVNVTITASTTGILIPPSHNMIIYSLAAGGGVSIATLFMAGIVPGVLTGLCLMVAAWAVAVKRGYPKDEWPGWGGVWTSFLGAAPGLFATVIIIGGTLSGVFTVTESAAAGAIYALLVTLFVYRSLSLADFWKATINATKTTAMVMLLIGTASAFGYVLALHQVPAKTIELMHGISTNPYVVLFIINIILLVLGCIMDMAGLILICTPIFLPVVKSIGMDPVQFGMLMMLNLGTGLCTPPVGTCLFVGCSIGKIRIEEAVKTIWPFYLAMFVALMFVTYVPAVSLWVPYTLLK